MEKIRITNFKAIKNTKSVEIPIKNLLLMIGDNASGKSTVATLVYFFKSLKDEIFDFVLKEELSKDNFYRQLKDKLTVYFTSLFGNVKTSFKVTYYYKNYDIEIFQDGGYNMHIQSGLYDNLERICFSFKKKLLQIKKENEGESNPSFSHKERQIAIRIFYDELNQLFGIEETLYFLPNRNITVSLENRLLPIYSQLENALMSGKDEYVSFNDLLLLRLINYLDKTLIPQFRRRGGFRQVLVAEGIKKTEIPIYEEIITHLEKIIRGKYTIDEEGEKIIFEPDDFKSFVYLNEASSGQKEVIRILQDFFWSVLQNKTILRIIDEPEIHLYPNRQKEFVELCAWLINANPQNKLILPTHSPYILTALNNCLYAGNIAKTKPEAVEKIIPKHFWLTSEQVSTFMLKDGEFENLIDDDSETKLIEASRIDEVSQILNDTLDQLIEIDNT